MSYAYVINPNGSIMTAKQKSPLYYTGFINYQLLNKGINPYLKGQKLANMSNNQKHKILTQFLLYDIGNENLYHYLLNQRQRNQFNNNNINANRMINVFLQGNYSSQRNGWQKLIHNLTMRQRALNHATYRNAVRTPLSNNN